MIKGILFDLDGTLLYTLQDLCNAVNYALVNNGLSAISLEKTKEYIGSGIKNLMIKATKDNPKVFDKAYQDFKDYYSLHCIDTTIPYKGIIELLERLRKLNIKIAVVSNKYQEGVDRICNKLLKEYIPIFIGARSNIKIKPETDMVNEALSRLNLTNNECLFVGDSNVDIQTAKNANMKSVGVLWGYKDVSSANYTISNPIELINIILKENEND